VLISITTVRKISIKERTRLNYENPPAGRKSYTIEAFTPFQTQAVEAVLIWHSDCILQRHEHKYAAHPTGWD
jgi:hypothetical protein